ncbi:MAG: M3 family oligoendopeptidase [Spirochaetia bacterium]
MNEADTLPTAAARVHFRNALRELGSLLYTLMEGDEKLSAYRFFLEEELENQQHQMTASEEALAADLGRSGADAWSRLQDSVSSTLSVLWDEQTGETKTVVELRSLAHDPDRSIRRHAWKRELDAWKQMETPLAFAINGVKGHTISLNERRGYRDPLDKATSDSRITRTTLDTLIGVAEESLPVFRRYLHAKAELLGLERAAFYDLFAPVGIQSGQWTFAEARRTIETVFGSFSDELAAFARNAFDKRWIDALPRKGKVGGAYCTSMPNARVSRVLANYDSTFSSVSTLAHELGHAYHHEVLKEHPAILRDYPMTLAETASIFSETLMFNHALSSTSGMEKLVILDTFLQDTTQVVVDILSRFYFEQSLFAARQEGELSPEELNSLMTDAQKRAYGDGLDETQLHPYMWAAKVHYYIPSLSFYNFPYTFGALFAMALFGLYESDTAGFPARYNELLEMTGSASAEQVTAGLGFDIQKPTFWRQGISVIERHVREFETLVAGK